MKRELALEFTRVTEHAALASYEFIGKGDKNAADDAAVKAMRSFLNKVDMDGEIIIGEGEIDEAPMLYIGEKLGCGSTPVEIAVDPIDGTRMVALGQDNAVAVMVAASPNVLLKVPDMYMEKIMVNKNAKGVIDLNLSIVENIKRISAKLNKPLSQMNVMTLYKPRHEAIISELQELGVKVIAIPDGDIAGSIKVAMPLENIDMFYGIGGAPEGIISAAIMKCLDGDMQARLIYMKDCKVINESNEHISALEEAKVKACNVEVNRVYNLDELCHSDDVVMSITGITDGTLISGVKLQDDIYTTETILIRGKSKTIRKIFSYHNKSL